ncbi:hypothetical protein BT96DRAFT_1087972, partial [Gymnopus androsaceus JB14]
SVNREELFNLRHAVARNVIEQIFSIVKSRWEVLNCPANFDMSIQARIPPALAALHNFILQFDPTDIEDFLNDPNILNEELDMEYYSNDIMEILQQIHLLEKKRRRWKECEMKSLKVCGSSISSG